MKNEVDAFLEELKGDDEQKDPFEVKEDQNDPFAVVKTDDEGKGDKGYEDDGDKVPFHKDPKVLKFIEKELEKKLEAFKPIDKPQPTVKAEEDEDDLVAAFTNIIGNDTPEKVYALKMLGKRLKDVEDTSSQRAIQRLQEVDQEKRDQEAEVMDTLNEGLDSIEDEFKVDITSNTPQAKKLKEDFIGFVQRVAPKDRNGEVTSFPDFGETFKLFKEVNKPKPNNRAKEISDRSMERSSESNGNAQLKDQSWNAVERMIQRLS